MRLLCGGTSPLAYRNIATDHVEESLRLSGGAKLGPTAQRASKEGTKMVLLVEGKRATSSRE